jgi:type IV secretory pathway VirJ component
VLVAVNEEKADRQATDDPEPQRLGADRSGDPAQGLLHAKPRPADGPARTQRPGHLVSGIGPGAVLAWRWLSEQKDDKAQAISVDLALEKPGCTHLLPNRRPRPLAGAWNDNPDDTSAGFVRDQPNAETSISDYDINLPQVLNNELRKILVGGDKATAAWRSRWLKCRPARPRTP